MKDTCFKIHGYPYWYKQLRKEKATASGRNQVNMASNPFEELGVEEKKEETAKWSPTLTELVQQEVSKILINKQSAGVEHVNFAQIDGYASNTASKPILENLYDFWILDAGATNHICAVKNLFASLNPLNKKKFNSFT